MIVTAAGVTELRSGNTQLEVFTALTMKNAILWDVMLCGSCKNRRFGGTFRFYRQGDKNRLPKNNVSSN
jgi:hypothetical protein